MNDRATDAELIQLVQDKLPEELSAEEIARLRERLAASPELQKVLIEQLHLEQYLTAALGEFSVSYDEIVRRAQQSGRKPRNPLWILGIVACLLVVGIAFGRWRKRDAAPNVDAPETAVTSIDAPNPSAGTSRPDRDISAPPTKGAAPQNSDAPSGTAANGVSAAVEPWVMVREAEEFDRGSLQVDATNYGDGIGVAHSGDQIAGFAEYDFEIPRDGSYQLELRYASEQPRPLKLFVAGKAVRSDAARQNTGDWWPEGQRSFVEARMPLKAGRLTIALQTDGLFPHLDKLAIAELTRGEKPAATETEGLPVLALRAKPSLTAEGTPAKNNPWDAALDASRAPVPFLRGALASFPLGNSGYEFPTAELQQWLEPAPGAAFRVFEETILARKFAGWEGTGRLKSPWPRDAVLRLGLFDFDPLRLHFWNGTEGVTLQWWARPGTTMWAAYLGKRKASEPFPTDLTLVTTDGGRHLRTELGPIEIRHQAGQLVVTRGDLGLLTVPMPRPPKDVFFEGKARVSGIALYRGQPAPAIPQNTREPLLATREPAELKWISQLASSDDLQLSADGTLELKSPAVPKDRTPSLLHVGTLLERRGLYEVIVKVSDADVGTGVFLGDIRGNPVHHIGFFRDKRSLRTTFGYGWSSYGYEKPTTFRTDADHDPLLEPVPWAAKELWLRLIVGSGSLRIYSSGDGMHWGQITREPIRNVRRPFASVGLYAVTGEQPRHIRLEHLEVREFSSLRDVAGGERWTEISPPDNLDTIDATAWHDWALKTQPPNVEFALWRRACAYACLMHNPRADLSALLLRNFLIEAMTLPIPAERRIAVLEDAALLSDLWPGGYALPFTEHYSRLGEALAREGHPDPFSLVASALVSSPISTEMKFNASPPGFVKFAALWQINAQRWRETRDYCQRLRHWLRSAHPDPRWQAPDLQKIWWTDWADAIASHWQNGKPVGDPPAINVGWRHPLVAQISKEGYNVLSELDSALAGRNYDDACQLIAAAGASGALGLLPDAKEPELFVSMPRAIALAMRDHPGLLQTMREKFGRVGLLRVRQAAESGHLEAIAAATVQYYGTEAAAEAHRWLGDRAVSAGRFGQGIDHYRDALTNAPPSSTGELHSRIRLAAALLGQPSGEAGAGGLSVGAADLTAAQLESLIEEFRKSRSASSVAAAPFASVAAVVEKLAPPSALELQNRGRLPGDLGNAPAGGPGDVDWTARQLAIVPVGNQLLVSNRFQVQLWNIDEKRWAWAAGLGGEQGNTHSWTCQAMRPAVAGERVFARRLTKAGPELVALERATGKVLWRKRPENHVASDPIYSRGKLFAVVCTVPDSGFLQFQMTGFNAETGDILSEEPLFRTRNVWGTQPPCNIVEAPGRMVVACGGSLACCDLQGRTEWLRKTNWMPASIDPLFHQQAEQPPLVSGDRVYVTLPGSHAVTCVELNTGRLRWTRPLPDARRLLGLAGDRVIAQSNEGLSAYDVATGRPLWRFQTTDLLEGNLVGASGPIVVTRRIGLNADQKAPAVTWLEPNTGQEMATTVLAALSDVNPRIGPVVSTAGRWFCFAGKAADPNRDLLEIVPATGPAPTRFSSPLWTGWVDSVPPKFMAESARILPEWAPAAIAPTPTNGHAADFRGEKDVLLTRVERDRPIRWASLVDSDAGKGTQLRLRVGHAAAQSWTLLVHANGRELLRKPIDDQTAPSGWIDHSVDLVVPDEGGMLITVAAVPSDPAKPGDAAWKSLEILRSPAGK